MKGIAKGSLFEMLKNALKQAGKRTTLDIKNEEEVEYTMGNLVALLSEKGLAEEQLATLRQALEEFEKIDSTDLDFLARKKYLEDVIASFEGYYKPIKILQDKKALEEEYIEAMSHIEEDLKNIEKAIRDKDMEGLKKARQELNNHIAIIEKAKLTIADLATEYKNLTGEEFETELPGYEITEDRLKSIITTALEAVNSGDLTYEEINEEFEKIIPALKLMAPSDVNIDKMIEDTVTLTPASPAWEDPIEEEEIFPRRTRLFNRVYTAEEKARIISEKIQLEEEREKLIEKINNNLAKIENISKTGSSFQLSSVFSETDNNIFSLYNVIQDLNALRFEYQRAFDEEDETFELLSDSFAISEDEFRKMYFAIMNAIFRIETLEEDQENIQNIYEHSKKIIEYLEDRVLFKLSLNSFDFGTIVEEENKKLAEIYHISDPYKHFMINWINAKISMIKKALDELHTSEDYNEIRREVADMIYELQHKANRYVEAEIIDNFVVITPLEEGIGINSLNEDLLTQEQYQKEKKSEDVREINWEIYSLERRFYNMHFVDSDDVSLKERYNELMEEVADFVKDYGTNDLLDIDVNFDENKFTIKGNSGVKDLDEYFLTEEQMKALGITKPPAAPFELTEEEKKEILIDFVNKKIDSINAIIDMILAIPTTDYDWKEKIKDSLRTLELFIGEIEDTGLVIVEHGKNTIKIKAKSEGVTELNREFLTPEQIELLKGETTEEHAPAETRLGGSPRGTSPSDTTDRDEEKRAEVNTSVAAVKQLIEEIHHRTDSKEDIEVITRKIIRIEELLEIIETSGFAKVVRGENTLKITPLREGISPLEEVQLLTDEQFNKLKPEETPSEEVEEEIDEETEEETEEERLAREESERLAEEARKRRKKSTPPPSSPEVEEEKKADKEKYLNCLKTINLDIATINSNNEQIARMATYNPDEIELEVKIEQITYKLEQQVLDQQLELSNLRLEYFKKYGEYLLSDPEVLAAKQDPVTFGSSADLDAFLEVRNIKIIQSEDEIVELSTKIDELKATKEAGYELKIVELENRIKKLQAYIRTENSVIQRRLTAEGKSIDISAYYRNRNEKMSELREKLKAAKPKTEPREPDRDERKPDTSAADKEKEARILEETLRIKYKKAADDLIKRVIERSEIVELRIDLITEGIPAEYQELNKKIHEEFVQYLEKRVESEKIREIMYIREQISAFYKKSTETGHIPTEEEVQAFIEGIDKKGLECSLTADLASNEIRFNFEHKEIDFKSTTVTTKPIEQRFRIYDLKLAKTVEEQMKVSKVIYERRPLNLDPEEIQKIDRNVATLVSGLSEMKIVRLKNKLKVLYTEGYKNKLQQLKASIQLLNTKTKGKKYEMKISDTPDENGMYYSEATVPGNVNFDNYSLLFDIDSDGERKQVELNLEGQTRSM